MHAMQLESKQSRDIDSTRFAKQFQNILKRLTKQEVKDKLDQTRYFREYALSVAYSDLSNSRARSGRNRHIHTAESNPEMVPDDLEVVTLLANQALPPEF